MTLTDRLQRIRGASLGAPAAPSASSDALDRLKVSLHTRIVDRLDLAHVESFSAPALRIELEQLVEQVIAEGAYPLNKEERERLVRELLDEILGLGPLEPLLHDPSISDILANTYKRIYIERRGKLEKTQLRFRDNDHLLQIINRIVARVGRRVDEASPMVDARLPDGSRVNAIVPPLAVDGPILSIRRFGTTGLHMADLVSLGSMTPQMAQLLEACVRARLNILISGGTGTGKTTLLNAMSAFIPDDERIITIEDAAELQLQQEHVVRLETRPPNLEGEGEIVARDLVRNSLRMRPDRIIVGEVRSAEVLDMLQAMNTGHEGSMATVHANSPRDALVRLQAMIGMSGVTLPDAVVTQMIARSLDLILQLGRGSDGKRRLLQISELTGLEGQVVQMQDLFLFRKRGVDDEGHVLGEYVPTGCYPRSADRLERAGYALDPALFAAPPEGKKPGREER